MGLFYSYESMSKLVGYTYAWYLLNPHKGKSQTGYIFTCGGTIISWRSTKHTIATTFSNHAEINARHKKSHECC